LTSSGDPCSLRSFPTRRSSDLHMLRIRSWLFQPEPRPSSCCCSSCSRPLSLPRLWESCSSALHYPPCLGKFWRALSSDLMRSARSEEHTSELQSLAYLVCRLLL